MKPSSFKCFKVSNCLHYPSMGCLLAMKGEREKDGREIQTASETGKPKKLVTVEGKSRG